MKKTTLIILITALLTSCTMRPAEPVYISESDVLRENVDITETDPPETQPPETDPLETQPPETDLPETQPPETDPPETQPPETDPPETLPPETDPPETQPPETDPPETQPPETDPLETLPPETNPPETLPLETDPPETLPPETNPPETQPPETDPPETLPPETNPPETLPPEPEQLPYSNIEYDYITTDYFIYALVDDIALAVQEYIGPQGIIVMQPILEGYDVTGILPDAFADDTGVQVCVTDSVIYVSEDAFPENIGAAYYADPTLMPSEVCYGTEPMYWDWESIAFVPWKNRNTHKELFQSEHAKSASDPLHPNRIVATAATTQIFCERSPEEDFTYTIENGEVTVTGYIGTFPYVSIPSYIEDYPVRKTGFNSFADEGIIHLQLPGTLTYIDHFTANTAYIMTVHILDGEDYVWGKYLFSITWNHVRVHKNCTDEMDFDGVKPERYNPGSHTTILNPEGSFERNRYQPSFFTYPEE